MRKVILFGFIVIALILLESKGFFAQNDVLMLNYINGETKSYIVSKLEKIEFVISTNIQTEKSVEKTNDLIIFPNPAVYMVDLKFTVNKPQKVKVAIFDILGTEIKSFESQKFDYGENIIHWDGKNNQNIDVQSGIYHAILQFDNQVISKSFQIIR